MVGNMSQSSEFLNSQGLNPLMFASQQKHDDMIKFLAVRTRNLNQQDNEGMTILMYNILSQNYDLCSRILCRGAKIDMVNKFGKTALHMCVEKRLNEQIDFLL